MTDIEQLAILEKTFTDLLDGETGAILEELKPTVKELLTLAFREKPLEKSIGMCGVPCDGTCMTCNIHMKFLVGHFAKLVVQQEKEQEEWEEEQRRNKEMDDLNQQAAKELDEHFCETCGYDCIPYEIGKQNSWPKQIGYCGFPCDGRCYECGGGESGLDWNESGYFD